eukprot:92580_1
MNIYNKMYLKAINCLKSNRAKKVKCINATYGIGIGQTIQLDHLFTIATYTDLTKLCTYFSSCFRKVNTNETTQQLKSRNAEFWHYSKYLRECVECFGNSARDSNNIHELRLFHGVSVVLLFDSFIAYFCGPTSTSLYQEVTVNYAGRNGMILELGIEDTYGWDLYYFGCSWISCFSNEEEYLLFGGNSPVQFNNVRIIEGALSYKDVIAALKILVICIKAKRTSSKISFKKKKKK